MAFLHWPQSIHVTGVSDVHQPDWLSLDCRWFELTQLLQLKKVSINLVRCLIHFYTDELL